MWYSDCIHALTVVHMLQGISSTNYTNFKTLMKNQV